MHHPRCVDPATQTEYTPKHWEEPGGCRLGGEGHCQKCPHRGHRDPRWTQLQRIQSLAYSVEKGYPHEKVIADQPEIAAVLWPVEDRDWIASQDRWVERASYHESMATQRLIRTLLTELYDVRAVAEAA